MSFLIDTNVVSELARPDPERRVVEYVEGIDPGDVFLSAMTIGELVFGVSMLPDRRVGARHHSAHGSMVWSLSFGLGYCQSIAIWPISGELTARAQRQGIVIPTADGLIAATALHHGLRVVTRNTRHFVASGAPVVDPWEER